LKTSKSFFSFVFAKYNRLIALRRKEKLATGYIKTEKITKSTLVKPPMSFAMSIML
jgi:hypothetical protein